MTWPITQEIAASEWWRVSILKWRDIDMALADGKYQYLNHGHPHADKDTFSLAPSPWAGRYCVILKSGVRVFVEADSFARNESGIVEFRDKGKIVAEFDYREIAGIIHPRQTAEEARQAEWETFKENESRIAKMMCMGRTRVIDEVRYPDGTTEVINESCQGPDVVTSELSQGTPPQDDGNGLSASWYNTQGINPFILKHTVVKPGEKGVVGSREFTNKGSHDVHIVGDILIVDDGVKMHLQAHDEITGPRAMSEEEKEVSREMEAMSGYPASRRVDKDGCAELDGPPKNYWGQYTGSDSITPCKLDPKVASSGIIKGEIAANEPRAMFKENGEPDAPHIVE